MDHPPTIHAKRLQVPYELLTFFCAPPHPVSRLYDDGLQRLHSTNDVAINLMEGTALKAPAKYNK